jgi:hypothetical protein
MAVGPRGVWDTPFILTTSRLPRRSGRLAAIHLVETSAFHLRGNRKSQALNLGEIRNLEDLAASEERKPGPQAYFVCLVQLKRLE